MQKRFEDALKKLSTDLEMKTGQRDEAREKQRMMKEGIPMPRPQDDDEEEEDEDDLFGDETAIGGSYVRGEGVPVPMMSMNMDMDMDMD